ncbi:SDR family NAD(P)-dependent oxidoreductase [Streptomyces sp. NPDC051322]|uniref:SDR family NAD(P)-dependent oxidoreductase n=1 Tax=Streptomyces sp. NPDC051322 TaxID=3154645 RepID=UPI00344B6CC6
MSPLTAPPSMSGLSAVVTGGSRGLGLLMARQLAAQNCTVTIVARDGEELKRADELLHQRPGAHIRTAVCDVRDREAVREMFDATAQDCGGIDVVIANAGIIQVAPVKSIGADEFDAAMDTIFHGALHTSLEALPHLRRSRAGGRLALIGSVGGLLGVPHLLPYSCAKSAVGALAEGLYAEAAPDGVTVTAVHPGLMRTGSHLHAEFGGPQQQEFAWFSALAGTPLVSMDAGRAAKAIVRGVQRRRTRIVLTPAARAAGFAHGVAPALTTRLTALSARALPAAEGDGGALREGAAVEPPSHPVARKLRAWGSALNDRAAKAYNQRAA